MVRRVIMGLSRIMITAQYDDGCRTGDRPTRPNTGYVAETDVLNPSVNRFLFSFLWLAVY
jgi:hypothetical protein